MNPFAMSRAIRPAGMLPANVARRWRHRARFATTTAQCSLVLLSSGNYDARLRSSDSYLGTSRVVLEWDKQDGEEEFRKMVRAFLHRPGFDNVTSLDLNAPHLLLDAAIIADIALHKPLLKQLSITARAFRDDDATAAGDVQASTPAASPWKGFKQLRDVDITLTDTRAFPHAFSSAVRGLRELPVKKLHRLCIVDAGPHYGHLDCSLLLPAEYNDIKGVTLDRRGFWQLKSYDVRDCRKGV